MFLKTKFICHQEDLIKEDSRLLWVAVAFPVHTYDLRGNSPYSLPTTPTCARYAETATATRLRRHLPTLHSRAIFTATVRQKRLLR